jgi:hypothetical protein
MLSVTYTVADVKTKLGNDYSFFGYSNDVVFSQALQSIAEDVVMIYFYPKIGSSAYATIAAKNKSGLLELELYLYWAEIYTICVEFLKSKSATEGQLQMNPSEMLSVEGYRYQTSGGNGSAPGHDSLRFYHDKMFGYWKLAGFNILSLERTCTIFGDSSLCYPDTTSISAPDAPADVNASDEDPATYIIITWAPSSLATYYKVYRSLTHDGTYSLVSPNDATLVGTSYSDDTVETDGTFYYYKIKAYNASGESAYSAYDVGSAGLPT